MNNVERAKLLEYLYYVDRYGDANLQMIGALGMAAGGVIGIVSSNSIGVAGGIALYPWQ